MTCPSGKVAYASPQDAALVVRAMLASTHSAAARRGWARGSLVKHYHCDLCRAWHVGHETPKGKRA